MGQKKAKFIEVAELLVSHYKTKCDKITVKQYRHMDGLTDRHLISMFTISGLTYLDSDKLYNDLSLYDNVNMYVYDNWATCKADITLIVNY